MTVSSQTSRIEQLGDGTTTAFAVNFYFLENSDLKVFVNGVLQTITTNYTVTGAGNPAGGTVTFVTAPANGVQVVIFRDPAVTQGLDYIDNDPFPAESHERGLDKLTMIAQRVKDLVSRALRLGDSVVGVSTELPALSGGQLLGTNPGGTGFQLYPLGSEPDTAANIVYAPAGTGAVATTVQNKLQQYVNVLDYMTDADKSTNESAPGTVDVTYAFEAAQNEADYIDIPAGIFLLDEFKQKNKKVFRGAGIRSTFIKQKETNRPAWYIVSKLGVYEEQIIGSELTGVWFYGKVGSTVATCLAEAIAPFVIANCKFDFGGSGGFHTFEVITGVAFEFYNNTVRIVQQDPDGASGNIGSYDTGVVCGTGVYNQWYLRIVGAQNGVAYSSNGFNEVFNDPVTDGQHLFTGQSCLVLNPVVEAWQGGAVSGAIRNLGFNNKFINITLTNVPSASVGDYGIVLNSADFTPLTILGYKVLGSFPATAPIRPILFGPNCSGTIIDAETSGCRDKVEVYTTYDQLKNFTITGDSTSFSSQAKKFEKEPVFVTGATYTVDSDFATTGQLDETVYLNSSADCVVTLPSAASFAGRKIYFCSRVAFKLDSASANIIPLTGGGTPVILPAAVGKWAILQAQSSGNWAVIANN